MGRIVPGPAESWVQNRRTSNNLFSERLSTSVRLSWDSLQMVSMVDVAGLLGAATGLLFGALLGARWGALGALASALGGAVAGLCGGFFFMACMESYGIYLERLQRRRRVFGTVLSVMSIVVFFVSLLLLGYLALRLAASLLRPS